MEGELTVEDVLDVLVPSRDDEEAGVIAVLEDPVLDELLDGV